MDGIGQSSYSKMNTHWMNQMCKMEWTKSFLYCSFYSTFCFWSLSFHPSKWITKTFIIANINSYSYTRSKWTEILFHNIYWKSGNIFLNFIRNAKMQNTRNTQLELQLLCNHIILTFWTIPSTFHNKNKNSPTHCVDIFCKLYTYIAICNTHFR